VADPIERALNKKIRIKRGEKEQKITVGDAILEQWVAQAAKGDHRARRDLISYGDKHGFDVFAGQHKDIQEGFAEAVRSSSGFILTEEMLDRLSPGIIDELIRVQKEVEAEKKKTMH
jgi:hypothetical protein